MHHPLFAGWGDAAHFHDLVAKDIERLSRRLSSASGLKMRQELANPGACAQSLVAMLLLPVTDSAAKPHFPGGDSSSTRKNHQAHTPWRSLCGELADRAAQLEVLLALLAETMARCLLHTGITDVDTAMVATASACPTSRVGWVDKATTSLHCARNTVTMQRPDLQASTQQNAARPCADWQQASCRRDACAQTEHPAVSSSLQPTCCRRDACVQTERPAASTSLQPDELDLQGRGMMANDPGPSVVADISSLMNFRRRRMKEAAATASTCLTTEVIGGPQNHLTVRTAELHALELESQGDEVNHMSSITQTERSTVDVATSCCTPLVDAAVQVVIAGAQGFTRLPPAVQVSDATCSSTSGSEPPRVRVRVADAGVQAVQEMAHAALQVMPATVHAALQAEEPEEEPTAPVLVPNAPVLEPPITQIPASDTMDQLSSSAGSTNSGRRSGFRAALEQEEMLREHTKQRVTVLHEALLLERREAATARARLREAEQALEELQNSIRREPQVVQLPTVVQTPEPQPPASPGAEPAPHSPHQPVQDSHQLSDAAAADAAAVGAVTATTQPPVMSARDRPSSAARFAAPQESRPRRRAWTPSKQNRPTTVRLPLKANMRHAALL